MYLWGFAVDHSGRIDGVPQCPAYRRIGNLQSEANETIERSHFSEAVLKDTRINFGSVKTLYFLITRSNSGSKSSEVISSR